MNVELLEQVKGTFLRHPKRLDMGFWVRSANDGLSDTALVKTLLEDCGTTGCIAGLACALGGEQELSSCLIPSTAQKLLGLTDSEAVRLFYAHKWPNKFALAYFVATEPAARAEIAASRIDHFIETNGAE